MIWIYMCLIDWSDDPLIVGAVGSCKWSADKLDRARTMIVLVSYLESYPIEYLYNTFWIGCINRSNRIVLQSHMIILKIMHWSTSIYTFINLRNYLYSFNHSYKIINPVDNENKFIIMITEQYTHSHIIMTANIGNHHDFQ